MAMYRVQKLDHTWSENIVEAENEDDAVEKAATEGEWKIIESTFMGTVEVEEL